MNRQAVGAEGVTGGTARELGVLAVERLAGFWRGNLVPVVVTLCLGGADDGVRLGATESRR